MISQEWRRFVGPATEALWAAFSPDGRRVVSCGVPDRDQCAIWLWDLASGQMIRGFQTHPAQVEEGGAAWVEQVAFSPDGRQILSAGRDRRLRLWDAETGKEIRQFLGHQSEFGDIAFSPDGKRAVSVGAFWGLPGHSPDYSIRVWDVATGAELKRILGHKSSVTAVEFPHDGRRIVTGSDEGLFVWDAATGNLLKHLGEGTAKVFAVAVSPDGRHALTGNHNDHAESALSLWDLETGKVLRHFSGHEGLIYSVAFSHDGRRVVSSSGGAYSDKRYVSSPDNTVRLWDVESGHELCRFVGHSTQVQPVAFSPDDRLILSASRDTTVRLWEVPADLLGTRDSKSQEVKAPQPPATAPVREITRETRKFLGHTGLVNGVAFSPDGRLIASGGCQDGRDCTIRIWDVADGHEIRRWDSHMTGVWSVAFSPDGRSLLSGGKDKVARLWNVETGKEIRKFEGRAGWVYSVAFSPDGRRAISSSAFGDDALHLWDVESGAELRRLEGQRNVFSVAFSSDGKRVLSGGQDNAVILWDAASGKLLRRLEGHRAEIHGVAISPDGRLAISGGWADQVKAAGQPFVADPENCVVYVWDLQSGQLIRRLAGHEGAIHSVAFSPDGRYALSGSGGQNIFSTPLTWCDSRDNTVRLWDVHSGRELCRFTGHNFAVKGVAFSPDGRSVLSCGDDTSIRLWEIPRDVLAPQRAASETVKPGQIATATTTPPAPTQDAVREARSFGPTEQGSVHSVALSHDGRYAISGGWGQNHAALGGGDGQATPGLPRARENDCHRRFLAGTVGWRSPAARTARYGCGIESPERKFAALRPTPSASRAWRVSPDGRRLVSCCFDWKDDKDHSIRLWDVSSGRKLREFEQMSFAPRCIAFSPDGRQGSRRAHRRIDARIVGCGDGQADPRT